MAFWSEVSARKKVEGLPTAFKRLLPGGKYRYTFVHDEVEIDDPSVDVTGRFFVSPRDYGFTIRGFDGGRTAWAKDFDNGSMLVVNSEGLSHVLSPRVPARIVFVGPDGAPLQDTGQDAPEPDREPELINLRLMVSVTCDLHGESPAAARAMLKRVVDRALSEGPWSGDSRVTVTRHAVESNSQLMDDIRASTDTDFSKLLDL